MAKQLDDTTEENAEGKSGKQSFEGIRFLFSRRGRPTLIIVVIGIAVGISASIWLLGNLTGPSEEQRQKREVAASGKISAKARTKGIKGDLTSTNLTEEAQAAAKEYNAKADEDPSLHPTPTFEDVELVDVPDKEEKPEPSGLKPEREKADPYTYTPPVLKQRQQAQRETRAHQDNGAYQLNREQILQWRKARLQEVKRLRAIYQEPPEIASIDLTGESQEETQDRTNSTRQPRASRVSQVNAVQPTNQETAAKPAQRTEARGGLVCESPVVKAGEIVYAHNDINLNTDFRGPVRMTFLQGGLRNWIGMGDFELNEFGAKMNVTINRVISPDGQVFGAEGYVLDPKTTLWAMRSDVDRHLIYRYGGFGLATIMGAFQELAEARERESVTTSVGESRTEFREPDSEQVTYQLIGDFGEEFKSLLRDNINRPITVTLDKGERAGVLFEETLCGPSDRTKELRSKELSDPVRNG